MQSKLSQDRKTSHGGLTVLRCCLLLLTVAVAQLTAAAEAIKRTSDGRPDFSGIWQVLSPAVWNLEDHPGEAGVPAGYGVVMGGSIPYKDAALAQRQENHERRLRDDPEANCFMVGVPRITYMPYPFQIVQARDQVILLYEYVHTNRIVYLNGSKHPPSDVALWMGDSRGHWERDTLVVDVTSFNASTWLDRAGNFHSESLHVVERYTPDGPNHIRYQATIEDPEVFTRPWQINLVLYRRMEPGLQVLEYECYAYQLLKSAGANTQGVTR
jgi:hypothetical protein